MLGMLNFAETGENAAHVGSAGFGIERSFREGSNRRGARLRTGEVPRPDVIHDVSA